MRILAKKAFRFEVGLASYQCIPGKIQDMDDKFAESRLFKMARTEGSIEVIENAVQQKRVENDPNAATPPKKVNTPKKGKGIDSNTTEGDKPSDGGDAE